MPLFPVRRSGRRVRWPIQGDGIVAVMEPTPYEAPRLIKEGSVAALTANNTTVSASDSLSPGSHTDGSNIP